MQREKRALYLINGVYWITMGMYFPFISTFFLKRGMDTLQIGILTSISPVAAIAVQPLWARLADRTGKRKQVLMGLAAAAAVMILFYLKAYTFAAIFAVAVAFACVNSAVQPMSDALAINKAQEIGAEFSRIRMTGTITYAIAAFIIGFYLKSHIEIMFPLVSAGYLLFVLSWTLIPGSGTAAGADTGRGKSAGSGRIFRDNSVFLILFLAFLSEFGLMYFATYMGVAVIELGFDQQLIGTMSCISALSEVPVLLFIHKIYQNGREKNLLVMAVLIMGIRLLMFSTGNYGLMIASQFLNGPSFMVCYFVCVNFLNEKANPGKIAQAQSVFSMVQMGLGCLCGNLLGGALARALGVRTGYRLFGIGLIAISAAAAVFVFVTGRREKAAG